jgi:hypothetical protein
MSKPQPSSSAEQLLVNLIRELYQTETSAVRHCRREADRLGDVPPGHAMRAISEHATAVLPEWKELCMRENLPVSHAGALVGAVFSELRDKLSDPLIQSERSYRGTLLGARHGVDLVKMICCAADAAGKLPFETFSQSWLTTRTVLVLRAEQAMSWFAQHPQEASRFARTPLTRLRSREPAHA